MTHRGAAGANLTYVLFRRRHEFENGTTSSKNAAVLENTSTCFGNRDLSLFRLNVFGLLVWTKGKLQRL